MAQLADVYVDDPFVAEVVPPPDGFDELTPLICIVPAPLTGRVFKPLLATLGKDRSVYAPDMPGSGESDAPTAFPTLTVDDLEASSNWYQEALGFAHIFTMPGPGDRPSGVMAGGSD